LRATRFVALGPFRMASKPANRTQSELLFEAYLASTGIRDWEFEPPIPGQTRTPDYRMRVGGQELLFEVKELRQKRPLPGPSGAAYVDPYKSLRRRINDGRKKFKDMKEWCCSLVVCNMGDWEARLDPETVLGAMLGDLGFVMDFDRERGCLVPGTEQPAFLERGMMITQKTGEPQNTTISAVIVLEEFLARDIGDLRAYATNLRAMEAELGRELTPDERLHAYARRVPSEPRGDRQVPRVTVVENPFARLPLPRNLFTGPFDERWALVTRPLRIFGGNKLQEQEKAEKEANLHPH